MTEGTNGSWGFIEAAAAAVATREPEQQEGGFAAMMGGGEKSLEQLGKIWGHRSYPRRTHGNETRSFALLVLHAIGKQYALPQAEGMAEFMAAAWASEGGWDTERLIKAIEASTVSTVVSAGREDEKPEK